MYWNQYRLIDVLDRIDLSFLENDIPERDPALNGAHGECLRGEEGSVLSGKSRSRSRMALVSGIAAAGSVVLTGAAVIVCRKHGGLRKIIRTAA